MLTVTKIFSFCYGHYLPGHKGKCIRQHGHQGILEIEVSGSKELFLEKPYPGMVTDFGSLSSWVMAHIIEALDHNNINDLPDFQAWAYTKQVEWAEIKAPNEAGMPIPPTAENMVKFILSILCSEDSPYRENVERIRLYETPTSYAEWRK